MTQIRTAVGLLALDIGAKVTDRHGEVWVRSTRDVVWGEGYDAEEECMSLVEDGIWIEYVDLQPDYRDRQGTDELKDLIASGPFEIKEQA